MISKPVGLVRPRWLHSLAPVVVEDAEDRSTAYTATRSCLVTK